MVVLTRWDPPTVIVSADFLVDAPSKGVASAALLVAPIIVSRLVASPSAGLSGTYQTCNRQAKVRAPIDAAVGSGGALDVGS